MSKRSIKKALVMAAAVGLGMASQASALEWDITAGTKGVQGGNGTWDLVTPNWTGSGGTAPTDYPLVAPQNTTWDGTNAWFTAATTGTITISNAGLGVSANSLLLQSANQQTIAGEPLTLTGAAEINIRVNNGTRQLLMNSVLAGTDGLNVVGRTVGNQNNTVELRAANTISGTASIWSGYLRLKENGTLLAMGGVTAYKDTIFALDNTGAVNSADRIQAPVTLNSATLAFIGANAAASTESVDVLLASGTSTINEAGGNGLVGAVLTIPTLSRNTGATASFTGPLNTAVNQIQITNAPALLVNGILPFAVQGNFFATHGANGVAPDAGNAGAIAGSLPTSNVVAVAPEVLLGPAVINSLNVGGANNVSLNGFTLTLQSGGFLSTGGGINGPGTLTAGVTPAPAELFAHVTTGTAFVSPTITDNAAGGIVSLVKAGAGTLDLTGSPGNLHTGGTYIGAGTVKINNANQLGVGPLLMDNGTLDLTVPIAYAFAQPVGFTAGKYNESRNTAIIKGYDGGLVTFANNTLGAAGGPGTLSLISDNTAATVGGKLVYNLGNQAALTPNHAILTGNAVYMINGANALGGATIVGNPGFMLDFEGANAANGVNIIRPTGVPVLANNFVLPSVYGGLQIDTSGVITLLGDFLRANPGANAGAIGIRGGGVLNIGQAFAPINATPYTDAAGLAAVNGTINVYRSNATPLARDVQTWNNMGVIQAARGNATTDGTVGASTINWWGVANGGTNQYYYAAMAIETRFRAQTNTNYAGPTPLSKPLTLNVDSGVTVSVVPINTGGFGMNILERTIKTGGGTLSLDWSRGAHASTETYVRGAGDTFEVRAGTLMFRDLPNNAGTYASGGAQFFDGGVQDGSNGQVAYAIRGGTLGAKLYGTSDRTLRSDIYINYDDSLSSVAPTALPTSATIQVGDLVTDPAPVAGRAVIIGTGLASAPTPTMYWNGPLVKTGLGELRLAAAPRVYNIAPGSSLTVGDAVGGGGGLVTLNENMGTAATAGPTPAVANLTVTVGDPSGGNAKVALGVDQDLAGLSVTHAAPGTQTFDLASPAGAGSYRSVRIYSATPAAAEASLWASICNANVAGAIDPLDGIIDSGKAAHASSAIGLTNNALDAAGAPVVLLRLTREGDANCDGTVNFNDLLLLSQNYGTGGKTWDQGDFTYDSQVNFNDLLKLSQNYGQSFAAPAAGTEVPEPGVLSVLALAAAGMLGRRRR